MSLLEDREALRLIWQAKVDALFKDGCWLVIFEDVLEDQDVSTLATRPMVIDIVGAKDPVLGLYAGHGLMTFRVMGGEWVEQQKAPPCDVRAFVSETGRNVWISNNLTDEERVIASSVVPEWGPEWFSPAYHSLVDSK